MSPRRSGKRSAWLRAQACVLVAEPPYEAFRPPAGRSSRVLEGVVVAVPWRAGSVSSPGPWDLLREARRAVPDALLVLYVERGRPTAPEMVAVARRAAASGARVTLVGEEPTRQAVRDALGASGLQGVDVARWLKARLGAFDPEERGACDCLGRLVADLELLARERDALRRTLGPLGLPTLHKWEMLARVLPPVVDLQSGEASSVGEAVARHAEAGGRRTLDRRCVALTGLTARKLGGFLGWEVVLECLVGRKSA